VAVLANDRSFFDFLLPLLLLTACRHCYNAHQQLVPHSPPYLLQWWGRRREGEGLGWRIKGSRSR